MRMKRMKEIFNLPVVLFIIILVNYMPLIISNMMSKASLGVSTKDMMICFIIEIILLLIMLYKKVEFTKISKGNFIALLLIIIVLLVIQVKNFFMNEFDFFDVINIDCILINITLLYVAMLNIKTSKVYIYRFFKGMIAFGIVACIVNTVLYWNEICSTLGIGAYIEYPNIKSFFANRNQFAFFLFVALIANYMVLEIENKICYKIIFVLFMINLVLTMSRTGILAVLIWLGLVFLITDKFSKKTKIYVVFGMIALAIISLVIIVNFFPEIWTKIDTKFLRLDQLGNLSGRTDIWDVGNKILVSDPLNFLFGVGRFKSTSVLHLGSKTFTQFHNIYLDLLLTGGISLLLYVLFIYGTVIRKVMKSNLSKSVKKIYITIFITYGIYIFFESFGRFSIGSSDTLCLIFFITIPLLHANSIDEDSKDNKVEKTIKINTGNDFIENEEGKENKIIDTIDVDNKGEI